MSRGVPPVDARWRSSFRTRGHVVAPRWVNEETLADLLRAARDRQGAPPSSQVLYTHEPPPADTPPMTRLMNQWFGVLPDAACAPALLSRLAPLLEGVTGERMVPFQDVVLNKQPGHEAFPWHTDQPFWPLSRHEGAVTWIALVPVTAQNGALQLTDGSHRRAPQPAVDLHNGLRQDGEPFQRAGRVSCPSLEPGDVLVFHARTAHRSLPNQSPRPRLAWAISWVAADATWQHDQVPRHPMNEQTTNNAEVRRWSSQRYPFGG